MTANLFERSPLINIEHITSDWWTVLGDSAPRPRWARRVVWIRDPTDRRCFVHSARAIVVVGKKHIRVIDMPPVELSALYELTRLGGSVVTNSNFNKPVPQIYAKLRIGSDGTLLPIRRILWGAGAGEATKAIWRPNDYSVENTYVEDDPHPDIDARAAAMAHVEQLVWEREAAGTLPTGFDVRAYLDNIRILFAWIDNIRTPPADYLPLPPRTPRMIAHASATARARELGLPMPPRDEETDAEIRAWKRQAAFVYRFNDYRRLAAAS